MAITTLSFPTTIRFGVGARREIGGDLSRQGVTRPLVVTDRGVADLPWFDPLLGSLADAGLATGVFSDVHGNPTESQVRAGAAAFGDHGADALVGVGGGAALDVAKAIGVLVSHDGSLFDYEDGAEDSRPIDDPIPWFVAVPTTAGTGSEVGRSAVIADDGTHVKKILFSPHLLARSVFADPELTVGLPRPVTIATGMDALTHNVEAYLATGFNPLCDGIAVEAVRLCGQALPRVAADGSDIDARSSMLIASMMGAVAFQKGLGLVHSCAHALGTACDLHHGLANALMIDHAIAFNVPASGDRMARLGHEVGAEETPEGFLSWLAALKARLEIPADLQTQGIDPGVRERLVELAVTDRCHLDGPRPVRGTDFEQIFATAFG